MPSARPTATRRGSERVRGHQDGRVERLTDAAVAEEMAAGRFPAGDALQSIRVRAEAAVHLADLAEHDPQDVYVVGCSREILLGGGGPGGYLVLGGVTRTISRPDQRVALIVAAGVSREDALVRLAHIQAHVAALPAGSALAPASGADGADGDAAARLEAALRIVLEEEAPASDG
jgi:hypothetical protein